jgi:small subunit ribosomal protein S1
MQNVVTRNGQTETSPEENFEELFEQYLQKDEVKEGEITKGRVIRIGKEFVVVDIAYKSEGQIPIDEFIGADGKVFVKEGDLVDVFVDAIEDDDGVVDLSKEKADKLKIWDEISLACERDELVEGMITSRVKGGLTVDIGVKAFLPGSQVDLRPVRNLDKYIGQTYQFKVIKFNKRRGNIVLSRRALLEKERAALKAKTLETLEVGKNVKGIVKNITEYGCFVDLGGIDGLLHITDMSWGRINHPSEMFEVGDEVEVKVLKFDPKTERVSLGLKQITEDPWIHADQRYTVGDKVKGKVVSLTDYGAFVELEEGIEGLIHISEMSWTKRVKHPSKVVSLGDIIEAVILDIDAKAKRISLGMKQTEANPWTTLKDRYPVGTVVRAKVRNITNFGIFLGIEEGIDGLVHISDLSWSQKVRHPQEVFKKGDEVEAVVLNIDVEKERFSLGIKQLRDDPWQHAEDRYPIGSVVEGTVTKILDFGAIVELEEDLEGLIHISELSRDKVENVGKVLTESQRVRAKVINLIPEERKIGLSLRRLQEGEESEQYAEYMRSQKARSSTRLGDLLRDKIDLARFEGEEAPAPRPAAPRREVKVIEAPGNDDEE